MGFNITGGSAGFGDALLIVIGLSVAIPVLIWFFLVTKEAHDEVTGDSDTDLEA